jgi:hypothetical protein
LNERRIHLHVENSSDVNEVFDISASRVRDALARHPEIAARARVSIGYGGDILDRELATADAVFCWDFDRRDLRRRGPKLRWVHIHGAGVSHMMPLDWLPSGAVLTNSRGVHAQRATEYAFMAILLLNNRLPEMIGNQQRARWQELFNAAHAGSGFSKHETIHRRPPPDESRQPQASILIDDDQSAARAGPLVSASAAMAAVTLPLPWGTPHISSPSSTLPRAPSSMGSLMSPM